MWGVVNEVVARNLYAKNPIDRFWYDRAGPEYIELAFQWAREADPNAILMLDEAGNEDRRDASHAAITDGTYELLRQLKAKGATVDAVGMQMHLDIKDPPSKAGVMGTMRRYAGLGLEVHITGIDVNAYDPRLAKDDRLAKQAQVYRDMLEAALESGVCKGVGMFGLTDAHTWVTQDPAHYPYGPGEAPLPFDENYQPKPAYFAIHDVLAQRSGVR